MKKINFTEKTRKIVSTVIIAVILIGISVGGFFGGFYTNKNISEKNFSKYSVEAIVVEVNPDTSEVFFETPSGHNFFIVTDEIFAVNEQYTLTFSTNNTPTVEDDEIYHISRNIEMSMY